MNNAHKVDNAEADTIKLVGLATLILGKQRKMVKLTGYWKLRMDVTPLNNAEGLKEFFKSINVTDYETLWYYHEEGKEGHGPHVHALLKDCNRSDVWLRQRIKDYQDPLGLSKAGSYSVSNTYSRGLKMTEQTIKGYVTYMAKGKLQYIHHTGNAMKDLGDNAHDDWVFHANKTTPAVVDERKENHRVTTHQLAQEAYGLYLDKLWADGQDVTFELTPTGYFELHNKKRLAKAALAVCTKHKKGRNVNMVASIIQTALADLDETAYYNLLNKRLGW